MDNSLLMIVLVFVLGCMCSDMMKKMCGGRLVEGMGTWQQRDLTDKEKEWINNYNISILPETVYSGNIYSNIKNIGVKDVTDCWFHRGVQDEKSARLEWCEWYHRKDLLKQFGDIKPHDLSTQVWKSGIDLVDKACLSPSPSPGGEKFNSCYWLPDSEKEITDTYTVVDEPFEDQHLGKTNLKNWCNIRLAELHGIWDRPTGNDPRCTFIGEPCASPDQVRENCVCRENRYRIKDKKD